MRLNRILVFPFFLSASWINSPNRDAFHNAQRIPWELEFDSMILRTQISTGFTLTGSAEEGDGIIRLSTQSREACIGK
jgi:hypothetical protein